MKPTPRLRGSWWDDSHHSVAFLQDPAWRAWVRHAWAQEGLGLGRPCERGPGMPEPRKPGPGERGSKMRVARTQDA